MANGRPWSFDDSLLHARQASRSQEQAEQELKKAFTGAANAQQEYRVALAQKILELRAEGLPATLCQDLAKGDPKVSSLRLKWDISEGVKEAMQQAAWRRTADRKDVQSFIHWSRRKDEEEDRLGEPIG
jgi:hypothetical protein